MLNINKIPRIIRHIFLYNGSSLHGIRLLIFLSPILYSVKNSENVILFSFLPLSIETYYFRFQYLELSPHHLVHYPCIALNQLHNLRTHILFHVVRHRNSIISVQVHLHCGIHCLQKTLFINSCQNKACLIQGFRPLRAGSNTYGWERMAYLSLIHI